MSTLLEKRGDLLDTKVPLLTRIKFPRVWKHLSGGVTIEDLQEDKYDEALEHIKQYFLKDEILCGLASISQDAESVESYLKIIRWWMQDTQSIIAVNEESGKIVGVIIARVLDLYVMKTMSRIMCYHGEALRRMQKFVLHMTKCVDINKLFDVKEYNQIFIWSVESSYRKNGIGKALLAACVEQTKSFKLTILTGLFTSTQSQSMASSQGFMSVYEQQYNWKEKSQIIFQNIGTTNKSGKFMAINLDASDYCRNICEEILQKYNIHKLIKKKFVKDKEKTENNA